MVALHAGSSRTDLPCGRPLPIRSVQRQAVGGCLAISIFVGSSADLPLGWAAISVSKFTWRKLVLSRLPRLRLVPQRVHLFERALRRRSSLARQRGLDIAEPPLELLVGAAQGLFRVDLHVAREVGDGEQQVA